MGFFNKNKKEKVEVNWIQLNDINFLDKIKEESKTKPQLIFKHSTRCSISSMALNRFESNFNLIADKVDAYYLDLIAFRDVSNEIANKFNVFHQSPQILLIKNGECLYDASHNSIRVDSILKTLD
jgi:bacillithiol system protein YtxJ